MNSIFVRFIVLLIGYFIGAIVQAGYWLGRFYKIDIREHGSGNAGTTNVMRTLGKKVGMVTYLLDALKPVLACVIVHMIYGNEFADTELLLFIYCGLGIILGHNFPFYLGFKGGKGIAATSGVVFVLSIFPQYCFVFTIVGFLGFWLTAVITKYVSLSSLIGVSCVFIFYIIWGVCGLLPLSGSTLVESYIIMFIITALGFIRHSENIKRLMNGTERKIGQKKEANNG